ncbi:cytosine permease [Mycolicibacterium vaccae]|uniref:Cytosine permease n=1 Tax=Mycolicibacterium vaccae ATCC 25954 TaxID=1194972 RepID=K0VJJ8_MYCVA|nr:cytosine permease [Mycolicibacterium vaccae]ANI38605.1 cobalamin biosynthesis protein [Mycolicibacterium vaccae 95051]EJZ11284.1 cytosine permease [Mycolicibacterium vaccae ATCC 25954]MCV7061376.1 cytosine permease [Mycolicibacterium vaccae]
MTNSTRSTSTDAASQDTRPAEGPLHLESEFEDRPVPQSHRRSTLSVSAVWFGFPMVLTCAIFGGTIVYGLGFWKGVLAIVVGNAVLFGYVGALSYLAGKTGKNFALSAAETFGRYGSKIVTGFLATVVIGWFAFQTGLTGATLNVSLGWNETLIVLIAGLLYIGVTFIGIRALTVIGMIAAPLFVILGLVAVILVTRDNGWSGVTSYEGGASSATVLSIGAAVTIVVASFIDSGTMTADFTRWSKGGKEAVIATFSAFPIANMIAMLTGAVIVAAGGALNPATDGGDFLPILVDHGAVLAVLAVIFVFVNLGSVCAHCLYNGAVGWSQLVGSKMRVLTLVLGAAGLAIALAGVWSHFPTWLNLLGIFVPSIGAVVIVDQLLTRRATSRELTTFRTQPFAAWIIGAACAYAVHHWAPQLSEAVVGMVCAAAAYFLIDMVSHRRATRAEAAVA